MAMKPILLLIILCYSINCYCQNELDSSLATEALKTDSVKYKITPIPILKNYVAKSYAKHAWFFKTKPIPGNEYHLVKSDSLSNKYWLNDRSGSPLVTANFYSPDNSVKKDDLNKCFWPKSTAESIKKKYGLKTWSTILKGDVIIGWNKELCELSWGEPNDIKTTTTADNSFEQWVYSSSYLYFENGKLTSIQN